MAKLFGKEYRKEQLMKKTGNLSQIGGMKEYTFNSGRAKGVDAIDVDAGDLKFTVLSSRCLDIGQASYKGFPFGYISKSGLRTPEYFAENKSQGFLDSFYGGLLTTSGLNNIGVDCVVDGREYGVHGEIANIPAEMVSKREYWDEDELFFEISGKIRHSRFYAEDLVMERIIQTSLGSNKLFITDTVENRDFTSVPLMLLYHINLGFPFLDSCSRLIIPHLKDSWPRTESAKKGLNSFNSFSDPVDGIEEECFYHTFAADDGKASVCLFNPKLGKKGMGVYLKYDIRQLPVFLQWKMMRSREYVCGFAPATTYAEGRKIAVEKNEPIFIEPLEKKTFSIEIGITEDVNSL
jgi:hypothetical protein